MSEGVLTGLGALAGFAVAPGIGGALGGAAAAKLASWLLTPDKPSKKKVFVSFDFDNDRSLKHLLVGQAAHPDATFEIADWSLKEAAPEHNWHAKARAAIRRCDLVLVLVGRHTYRARGVLDEIEMAREANKQVVQLIGRRNEKCRRVPDAGRAIAWTRPNLERLFSN